MWICAASAPAPPSCILTPCQSTLSVAASSGRGSAPLPPWADVGSPLTPSIM
eukprot:CAMPEP_0181241504 /NCGR_PEP_ID=MMETSP1096-20121128/41163_1 /TAXON_ID=156174 ORGANISM="Chrysochromulina ericina, Strain CCMP281" /NCGR_SAMPLE_ID=MMETSP1096 /ASSEMBLY_ACC=CAM_ASM_000453 /LENGTH=51 /DNA_ID=CAMNT_0023337593 /DNA_START=101 /DNA_END=253 /DNA_ORIENTATION=+